MTIRTQTIPITRIEAFDESDRDNIHRIINDLRRTYVERRGEALNAVHQAQRQVNRAEHELHRIDRHLQRVQAFCDKNNIEIEG